MKKSRMLLLFGGLFLMLVGYVAWCGRTFYLRAPVPDLAHVPEHARFFVVATIEDSGLRTPEKFTISRLVELLQQPYQTTPLQISVSVISQRVIIVGRKGRDLLGLARAGLDGKDGEWMRAAIMW